MRTKAVRVPGKSCPKCGGSLFEEIRPFTMERTFFGNYPFWVCSKCGTILTPPETYGLLEKVARAKGLFGARTDRLEILPSMVPVKGVRVAGSAAS